MTGFRRIPGSASIVVGLLAGLVFAQGAGPLLVLDPTSGPAGSSVHASGTGFDNSPCGVNLFLDSTSKPPIGNAPVDGGAFTTDVTIPAGEAPGQHVVIAVGLALEGEFCGGPSGDGAAAIFVVGEAQEGPFAIDAVTPVRQNIDLSTLPKIAPWREGDPIRIGPGQELPGEDDGAGSASAPTSRDRAAGSVRPRDSKRNAPRGRSALPPRRLAASVLSAPFVSVFGVPATGVLPPDVSGDVGPNHYIQAVNSAFMIFDKQGAVLAGPSNINGLWSGAGGPCETRNDGDPDVRYDPIANRWVVMQFVAFTDFCIAVSQSADPVAGGWFLYDFNTGGVPNDYPKIAVWPDAYYAGSQRGYPGSGADAWAFDRAAMLAGSPAIGIRFFNTGTFLLPSDLDGTRLPPVGAPNVFIRQIDGAQFGGVDRLELRAFHVDFVVPPSSTFTALPDLAVAPFDRNLCGLGLLTTCIPQPGTAQNLEAMTAWPLSRLQYRNFGTHEALVVNHGVDADGSDHAGVRWYELRDTGGGWSIFQQATHAPDQGAPGLADDPSRWMASAAMDKNGNVAVGYSVSSATVFPGLRYAGRLVTDATNTLPQGEAVLVAGGGSQLHGSGRWGDYASMTVDPADDCTMWFTSEYYTATSTAGWRTRIGSFRIDGVAPTASCPVDASVECSATGGTPKADPQLASFLSGASAIDDCDLHPVLTNNAPTLFPLGSTTVGFSATDANGNEGSCASHVNVSDTTDPVIVAPPDLTGVECTSPSGASPALGTPTVSDVCDTAPVVGNNAPPVFPLGTTVVTWTATDASGNVGADTQSVGVADTTPPSFTLRVSPSRLWPPNHKMVTITATIVATDTCDPTPSIRLVSIASDEPDNGTGDGNTSPDVLGADFGTDDRQFQLRAERAGNGDGRVYTITYVAEDASHNKTTRQATVVVPHNQ